MPNCLLEPLRINLISVGNGVDCILHCAPILLTDQPRRNTAQDDCSLTRQPRRTSAERSVAGTGLGTLAGCCRRLRSRVHRGGVHPLRIRPPAPAAALEILGRETEWKQTASHEGLTRLIAPPGARPPWELRAAPGRPRPQPRLWDFDLGRFQLSACSSPP